MLKRKVYQELLKWKENTEGKALCIIGARQIGKTTLIREFGKNEYEHFAEINFVLAISFPPINYIIIILLC